MSLFLSTFMYIYHMYEQETNTSQKEGNERNEQVFQTKPVIDDLRQGSFIKAKWKNKMLLVPSIITAQPRQVRGTCFFYIFLGKHPGMWCLLCCPGCYPSHLRELWLAPNGHLSESHWVAPCIWRCTWIIRSKILRSLSQGLYLFLSISTYFYSSWPCHHACLLKVRRNEEDKEEGMDSLTVLQLDKTRGPPPENRDPQWTGDYLTTYYLLVLSSKYNSSDIHGNRNEGTIWGWLFSEI